MSLIIVILAVTGCKTLEYTDPDSKASLTYKSMFTSATDVQIIYASPDKVVAVSIGSTQNDQVLEQAGDIIKAQNREDQ